MTMTGDDGTAGDATPAPEGRGAGPVSPALVAVLSIAVALALAPLGTVLAGAVPIDPGATPPDRSAAPDADGVAGSVTDLEATADRVRASPGGEVTVTFTVRNAGTNGSVGPALQVDRLPPDVSVVEQESNGTWRPDTREWFWLELAPGETTRARLTLALDGDAEGTYRIPARVEDANGSSARAEATVVVTAGDGGSDRTVLVVGLLGAAAVLLYWRYGTGAGGSGRG